jgi:hypothetical protein
VDQAHYTIALCRQRDSAGALDVNGAICLRGRLGQDANEVYDGIRPRDCSGDSTSSSTSA